jgi:hypothetical protein
MTARQPEPDLSELLLDVLSEGQPSADLLVRYADDPSSVSAAERQEIELELSRSPELRDQLAVLRRFPVPEPMPAPAGKVLDFVSRLRRKLSELELPVVTLVPLAAAAALFVVLALPNLWGPAAPPAGGTTVATVERPLEIEPAPSPIVPIPAPTPAPALIKPPPAAPAPAPSPAPIVEPKEPTVPPAPPARTSPAPTVLAEREPPAPQTAPETIALEDLIASVPEPESAPYSLNLPDYSAPPGAAERHAPGGTVRGTATAIRLTALGPDHVGQTSLAQPVLYWYLDSPPDGPGVFEFTVVPDDGSAEVLVSKEIARPAGAGFQSVRLSELPASLVPGVAYKWTVAFLPDPELPSSGSYTMRWIQRVPVAGALATRLAAARPSERAALLVEEGLWYDALASVNGLLAASPDDPSLRAARAKLLRQGGLEVPALSVN